MAHYFYPFIRSLGKLAVCIVLVVMTALLFA